MKFFKKSKLFIFVFCISYLFDICSVSDACAKTSAYNFELLNSHYDRSKIMIYDFFKNVTFVKDHLGRCYVIKQKNRKTEKKFAKSFTVVFEMLSAHIAKQLKIPAHHVRILPVGMNFPGKFIKNQVGTIHTLVPGCMVSKLHDSSYCNIDLKQYNSLQTSSCKLGLNRKVIADMALHPDLPRIVALDTFLCNRDRNGSNIFYDKVSDRFYAIDMENIYEAGDGRVLVVILSCRKIRRMLENNEYVSNKELQALKRYQETLVRLIDTFPPHKVTDLIHRFAKDARFKKKFLFDKKVLKLIENTNYKIRKAYSRTKVLVELLTIFISKHKFAQ